MLEVTGMDHVAQAMERTLEHAFTISSTLGRHTSDKMVSYYLRAPGGWDIEYGYDGLMVDEDQYLPQLIAADSYWGDDWSGSEPLACAIPLEEPVAEDTADSLAEPVVENTLTSGRPDRRAGATATVYLTSSSAIWMVLSAAPLRRLSPATMRLRPLLPSIDWS